MKEAKGGLFLLGKGLVGSAKEGSIECRPEDLVSVLRVLRDHSHCQYKVLTDIVGVDWGAQEPKRFEVVYILLSTRFAQRLRVKVAVEGGKANGLPSITGLYPAANWFEREVWDMYGIGFEGHPDLRRLLTDYGFEGHPMRKDFPLTGFVEVRYDEKKKSVVSEPLSESGLSQEFRSFDLQSPWTGSGR